MSRSVKTYTAGWAPYLVASWAALMAALVGFGMTQPWSWDDWLLPTLVVIVGGGALGLTVGGTDEWAIPWAGYVAAIPSALFAVGRFLPVYWERPTWQTIDAVSVACYALTAIAVLVFRKKG